MLVLALPAPAFADHELAATWGSAGSGPGELNDASGLATDSWDNVYVADYANHRIQKFSPDGELLHSWGSEGSGDGQFNHPKDVAVDSAAGYVYVADQDNNRIQKFTLGGAHVASFGSFGSGNGQFNHPFSVAVGGGHLYVVDNGNDRVQRLTTGGSGSPAYDMQWGSPGTADGQFDEPSGIAVSAGGTVYVTDFANNRVQYFSSAAIYQGQWGTSAPIAVDVSSAGVFVASSDRVTQFATSGSPPAAIDTWISEFISPQGVALGSLNQFFVSDLTRIRRLDGPVTGSVVRTSGTRLIFEAASGDTNNVTIEKTGAITFTTTDPGNGLTGGGGCSGAVGGTITCAFPATTIVSSVRVTTKDDNDAIEVIGSVPTVLEGGSGDDTLNGGDGTGDVVSYAGATGPGGVTVDLAAGTATGAAGSDTIIDVEGVTGSGQDDTFRGTAGANAFSGGAGTDTVSYANASGPSGVIVDLGAGTATGGDTLSGIENATGSQFADTITGGPGVNVITCLGGADAVTAEVQDTVAADCENVTRADAAPPSGGDGGGTGGGTGPGGGGGSAGPAPAPGATAPAGAPALSGLAVARMRSGKPGTFSYSLDKAANVAITVERIQPGRKVGRACKKQTRANRRKPRCTMFVPVGKLAHAGAAGRNTLRFTGKLSGRALKPGLYRATAVATGPSGARSSSTTTKFAVSR